MLANWPPLGLVQVQTFGGVYSAGAGMLCSSGYVAGSVAQPFGRCKQGQSIVANRPELCQHGTMDTAARDTRFLDADAFLRTDQREFGSAWRYELVRGRIVAHAAPNPEHGAILGNLVREIGNRLRGHADCRPEVGSGAAPKFERRDTARIPDATIRCGKLPRVLFEVISPSELQHKREWDQKRSDLQAVEGVQEIIEIFQDEILVHAWRRLSEAWTFESVGGSEAELTLPSVGISVPLAALYERVLPEEE
jgi:Uma2 family endonuclease